ncbi:MAG TPA: peptidoglycan-binding protein [Candidatus Udaeobacter sp.]|nr:peptidoglycan-binding protein [Candidatus Udaeobacter sp.]
MRILFALFCSLALAFAASGAQQEKKKPAPTKRAAPAARTSRPAGKPAQVQRVTKPARPTTTARQAQPQRATKPGKPTTTARQAQVQRVTKPGKPATTTGRQAQLQRATKPGKPATTTSRQAQLQRATKPGKPATTTGRQAQLQRATKPGKPATTQAGRAAVARNAAAKPFKAQRFNLATNTRPTKFASVNFQQGRRIQGSQNWQGRNYWAFRNYRSAWHDRGWWHNHYNRVVFVYGGWYAWNAGYWYPAWGYAPNAYYAYDGPIYGYNSLPPDQVVANVQAALQQQGYYQGEVDGLLGPLTRDAIAAYQAEQGLYTTSAIDQPTLESLGMT